MINTHRMNKKLMLYHFILKFFIVTAKSELRNTENMFHKNIAPIGKVIVWKRKAEMRRRKTISRL